MVADFFSKPLQGELFEKFRGIVLGIQHWAHRGVLGILVYETNVLNISFSLFCFYQA
jgi:hypothetical protein